MNNVKTNQDLEHLQLLSIFHYVVAGFLALGSLFPVLHLVVGIAFVSGAFDEVDSGQPPPAAVGWIFIGVASCLILTGLFVASCIATAGYRLSRYRSYQFCFVIAAMECLFMPIGTALGIFTLVVLSRPSVKELFR